MPLLEEALEGAGDPARAVAIELDLTYVHCNHNGNVPAADAHADRALALAEGADDPTLLAQALAGRAMVDFLLGRGVDWAMVDRAVALEGGDRAVPLYLQPSSIAACLKLWTGRYDEARAELTALRRSAGESGDESDLAYLLCWLAALEIAAGDLDAAGALADEAEVHAALAGSEFNRAWAIAQRALVMAHRGDVEATRAAAAEAGEICARFEAGNPMLWVAGAVGVIELATGNPAAAWAALEPAVAALAGSEPLALVLVPAVEALIAIGELDRAEMLLDALTREAQQAERSPLPRAAAGRARRPPGRVCRDRARAGARRRAARARPHAARAGPDRPPPQAEEGRARVARGGAGAVRGRRRGALGGAGARRHRAPRPQAPDRPDRLRGPRRRPRRPGPLQQGGRRRRCS